MLQPTRPRRGLLCGLSFLLSLSREREIETARRILLWLLVNVQRAGGGGVTSSLSLFQLPFLFFPFTGKGGKRQHPPRRTTNLELKRTRGIRLFN